MKRSSNGGTSRGTNLPRGRKIRAWCRVLAEIVRLESNVRIKKGASHLKYLLGIVGLVGLVHIAFAADIGSERGTTYKRYSELRALRIDLFISGRREFGARLRTAAILADCDKAGLADAVHPTGDERVKFFEAEFIRLAGKNEKNAQLLNALTATEGFDMIVSVDEALMRYEFGYREGVGLLKEKVPGICEAAVTGADKLLKKK